MGIDPVPIDPKILDSMKQYKINEDYARKCLEANKHNNITSTYYLLLKKIVKSGEFSIADVKSAKYDPSLFTKKAQRLNAINEM